MYYIFSFLSLYFSLIFARLFFAWELAARDKKPREETHSEGKNKEDPKERRRSASAGYVRGANRV